MIDLHMHSVYSDGTDTVIELLKKASKYELDYISITDHNTCIGYLELEKINQKEYYAGKIIPGIEINVNLLGRPIEILGYGINPKKMEKFVNKMCLSPSKRNKIEFKRLLEKCRKYGIKLPEKIEANYNGEDYVSKYLHDAIIQDDKNMEFLDLDAWNDSQIFYRKYMSNPTSKLFVSIDDILPSFDEACNAIKAAGGYVFIPHIYEYGDNNDMLLARMLKDKRIDGIECYYTTFTNEETEYLINICQKKHLFMSGGSDYHGKFKPNIEMAIGYNNLKIPVEIIDEWKNNVRVI